jgi:hypothetical protein
MGSAPEFTVEDIQSKGFIRGDSRHSQADRLLHRQRALPKNEKPAVDVATAGRDESNQNDITDRISS